MKKFRFSLHAVNTVRALRETQAREHFGASVRALEAATQAEQRARAAFEWLDQSIAASRQNSFLAAEQVTLIEARRVAHTRWLQALEALAAAEHTRDQHRAGWLGARRDLRLVEQLETKARASHAIELARQDQAALDERAHVRPEDRAAA
jgi:flagellar export protein FliJ